MTVITYVIIILVVDSAPHSSNLDLMNLLGTLEKDPTSHNLLLAEMVITATIALAIVFPSGMSVYF